MHKPFIYGLVTYIPINTSITATTTKQGRQKHNGHFNLSATFSRNISPSLKRERRSFVASCLLIFERFVVKYDLRPRNLGIFKSLGDFQTSKSVSLHGVTVLGGDDMHFNKFDILEDLLFLRCRGC